MRTIHFYPWMMILLIMISRSFYAQTFIPESVTDQTSTAPLSNPTPSSYQPRYISGFGTDDAFTIFYEDRDNGGLISHVTTTTGPTGFPASGTATNITDTHFCVKDWPITIDEVEYAYRGWGAVGNNTTHKFYVSDDMSTWTEVTEFTIPNAASFTDARGWVYYGFHDVILLNGTYYAFGESNQSQTMILRSANADTVWEAFDSIGGSQSSDGPLQLRTGITAGWTPSGNFLDLGYDRGYAKVHVDPTDSYFYLAINTAAKSSLSDSELETAFINPDNWTWHDNTTGAAANPILSTTAEHDLRECWVVPNSDPDSNWVIVYDADFGSGDGGNALGYALLEPPVPGVIASIKVWFEGPYTAGADSMKTYLYDSSYIPKTSPYIDERIVDTVPPNVVDWVLVELRSNADSDTVAQKSFFLRKDGYVVDEDGTTTELEIEGVTSGDYYIVVRHRNHLAIMSDVPQSLSNEDE
ncbi:hypothetical protein JW835_09760 [bacterium]|nr:hypothetical protein [bacterium]